MAENNSDQQKSGLSWSQPSAQKPPFTQTPPLGQSPLGSAPKPPMTHLPPRQEKSGGKWVMWTGGVLVVMGLILWIWSSRSGDQTPLIGTGVTPVTNNGTNTGISSPAEVSTTPGSTSGSTVGDSSLTIPSPQDAGLAVAVLSVMVTEPTWVVVYENYNGQPGNALGAALFGADRTSGTVDLLRGTLPGKTYFVGKSRDDGDRMFSLQRDPAIRDLQGNPVLLQFQTR